MTDRPTDQAANGVTDDPGPGSDPGEGHRRALDEEEVGAGEEEERGPDVGDVYRSGS